MLSRILLSLLVVGQISHSAYAADGQYLYRSNQTGVISASPGTQQPTEPEPEPISYDFAFGSLAIPNGAKRGPYSIDLKTLIEPSSLKNVSADQLSWTWEIDPNRDGGSMSALPAGLLLEGSSISGTFANSGIYQVLLSASYNDVRRSKSVTITSALPTTTLELSAATLPEASISADYSYDMSHLLTANGIEKSAVKWEVLGATIEPGQIAGLPDGVELSADGKITGIPTSAGTFVFSVAATWDDENPTPEHVAAIKTYTVVSSGASELGKLDIGDSHSCAVTETGGVKCWGQNTYGQLGNGTNSNSSVPVDVKGLTSGVKALAVGSFHSCAITEAGAVKCWGRNSSGQLGTNSTANTNLPTAVNGLSSGAVYITAADGNGSNGHTCVVMNAGGVKCWGLNNYGQLGNNSTTTSTVPVDVAGLGSGVTLVAAGSMHTCAVLLDGTGRCWGRNDAGQLGNGFNANSSVPVVIKGLTGIVALKAGGDNTNKIATCAVTGSGGLKCWGSNSDGQLGNGTTTAANVPTDVSGLTSGVVNVALGNRHACASLSSGAVQCWGWNSNGQLGNGSTGNSGYPVVVQGLSGRSTAIATGYQHSCAITAQGSVKCWGSNNAGQLGNGTTTQSTTAVSVSGT